MEVKLIKFDVKGDSRGSLVSLEAGANIPFDIKRVYYIYGNAKGVARGFHAHKNLKQVLVAVNGSCEVLLDDGVGRKTVLLDDPSTGLVVDDLTWREMKEFTHDAVLMVLASEYYDESDYIRCYDHFLKSVESVKRL